MLRFHPIADAKAAEAYYSKSDGGYYLDGDGLRTEWLGRGAEQLGLSGVPDFDHFKRLIHGLDPRTGEQLTAKLVDHRIPAWDVTASIPKGVTVALERGDARIQDALWEAVRETMADLEQYATTRVRKGGRQEDRLTGNLVAFAVEHSETRPVKSDGMPDPDRHIHLVVFNLTRDETEGEWKAVKFRPIMDLRKYFDRRFDLRLASKLTDLGYEIETKLKADGQGGQRYFSWDIGGMPESVVKKFSRRTGEIEKLAAELGVDDAVGKDKLGATSRQAKRTDLTLADCRAHWDARVTPEEARQVAEVIRTAMLGRDPEPTNAVEEAVRFALAHHFELCSVMGWHDLAVTAMERCLGGATPEQIEPEARRQGVLLKNGLATTRQVLAEETAIIDFAREGRGTMKPLAAGDAFALKSTDHLTLSAEQLALVRHVVTSPDRVVLVVGDAGTGKTRSVRAAFDALTCPVEMLAPSAPASRGVLREEGFAQADTVASFLLSERRQEAVRNGVIWIDEAGLLPIRDLSQLVEIARDRHARIILQGDPKQHRSVVRHGNMMTVLQTHAGCPVGRLSEIWRQKHKGYKAVVADIAARKHAAAFDRLADLGWVRQAEGHAPLIDDYLAALDTKKARQRDGDRVLVVAPTHVEGDALTATLRAKLKERGRLGEDERVFETLRPLGWTDAQKADPARYDGTEVLRFHRNTGAFRAGQRIGIRDLGAGESRPDPRHFSVYRRDRLALAVGDVVRITGPGRDATGRHKLDNGSRYTVAGITEQGVTLSNGWQLPLDFAHLAHGYVSTSHAAQGRTVDRVLIAMGGASRGAMSAEQFYVSVSRGRESATVYTDLPVADLRQAVQRTDDRGSATELMTPRPNEPRASLVRRLLDRLRRTASAVREGMTAAIQKEPEREVGYGR